MLRKLVGASFALTLTLAVLAYGMWAGSTDRPAVAATPTVPPEAQVLQDFVSAINANNASAASAFFATDGVFQDLDPSTGSFGAFGAAAIQSAFTGTSGIHVTLTSSSVSGSTVTGTSEIQNDATAAAGVSRAIQPFVAVISNGKIASLILHYDTTDAQTNTYLAYEAANPSTNNNGPQPTDFISLTMGGNETGDAGLGAQAAGVTIAFITVSPVPSGAEQPAAIRSGTCANLGGVVQQLAPVLTSGAGSFVSMSLDGLLASPHALAVGDPQNPSVVVSCADIVRGVTRRVTTLPGTGAGSTDSGFGYTWLLAGLAAFGVFGAAGSMSFRRLKR
jgi:hypothetical protein